LTVGFSANGKRPFDFGERPLRVDAVGKFQIKNRCKSADDLVVAVNRFRFVSLIQIHTMKSSMPVRKTHAQDLEKIGAIR
jgi:hypothetical protein